MVDQATPPNPVEQQIADMQANEQPQGEGKPTEYNQVSGMITDLDRRLRVLEERYGNLRKKIQLTDQNMIDSEHSFGKELKEFSEELLELKRNTNDFSEKILVFDSEMPNVAQKSDIKVIEKYLGMWNPTNYVTRNELREYLKSKKIKLVESHEESDDEDK